eukprot:4862812-Amphidinium_carterae.1
MAKTVSICSNLVLALSRLVHTCVSFAPVFISSFVLYGPRIALLKPRKCSICSTSAKQRGGVSSPAPSCFD